MTPKILPCYRYKDRVIARELDKKNKIAIMDH
jgi:hypothetical protein